MSKTLTLTIGSTVGGATESKAQNNVGDNVIDINVVVPAATSNQLVWSGSLPTAKVLAFQQQMDFAAVDDADENIVVEFNSTSATGDATQNWKPNSSFAWSNKTGIPQPLPASLSSDIITAIYVTNPDPTNALTFKQRFLVSL